MNKGKKGVYVVLILLVVIILSAFLFLKSGKEKNVQEVAELAAGEAVEDSELTEELIKEKIAEAVADRKLLLSEASKKGISVSDEEVDSKVGEMLKANGISLSELEADLVSKNASFEEFKETYKESMAVAKLLEQELSLSKVTVNDKDVNSYLKEQNQENLFKGEDEDTVLILKEMAEQRALAWKQQGLIDNYLEELKG